MPAFTSNIILKSVILDFFPLNQVSLFLATAVLTLWAGHFPGSQKNQVQLALVHWQKSLCISHFHATQGSSITAEIWEQSSHPSPQASHYLLLRQFSMLETYPLEVLNITSAQMYSVISVTMQLYVLSPYVLV